MNPSNVEVLFDLFPRRFKKLRIFLGTVQSFTQFFVPLSERRHAVSQNFGESQLISSRNFFPSFPVVLKVCLASRELLYKRSQVENRRKNLSRLKRNNGITKPLSFVLGM